MTVDDATIVLAVALMVMTCLYIRMRIRYRDLGNAVVHYMAEQAGEALLAMIVNDGKPHAPKADERQSEKSTGASSDTVQ